MSTPRQLSDQRRDLRSTTPFPLRFFTDRSHYRPEHHGLLLHMLRPLWELPPGRGAADAVGSPFCLVPTAGEADLCVLPMAWHYYRDHGRIHQALDLAATAKAAGKWIVVLAGGDHEPVVPIGNAIVFHPGPHRSVRRTAAYTFALPAFVPDSLQIYFGGRPQHRRKQPRPVVGFCGHGTSPWHRLMITSAKNIVDNVEYAVGWRLLVPEPVVPPVVLRARVLRAIARSRLVTAHFVIRSDYRAGLRDAVAKADPFHPTRTEFIRTIHESDYTLCIRGGGNFSLRLYETLALGRIPIFVNTDSILPFEFAFDWKQFVCWIDAHDLAHIGEKVADFHASLSAEAFVERQIACRALWEERLSGDGFHRHFHEHLGHIERERMPLRSI